jgi:hypothetical protein
LACGKCVKIHSSCFVEIFSGFAGALDTQYRRKEANEHDFSPEPSQPHLSPFDFLSILFPKKRGIDFAVSDRYGRFLSIITATNAMTTTIAIKIATDIGRKYCSAIVGGAVGSGVGVAGASTMLKAVSALDGQ